MKWANNDRQTTMQKTTQNIWVNIYGVALLKYVEFCF